MHLAFGDLTSQRLAPDSEALAGMTYVDIAKTVDRMTGEQNRLAFNAQGKPVDPKKEITALSQRRYDKYGILWEILCPKLAGLKDDDVVDLMVWSIIDFDSQAYDNPKEVFEG